MQPFRPLFFLFFLVVASLAGRSIAPAATFVVTNLNDTGAGSLRQAVLDSNLLGGSNAVVFALSGPNTILLSTGELLISNSVNIIGIGDRFLTIQNAVKTNSVFHTLNTSVSLSGMTIANGSNYFGGGILQQGGSLSLSNCTITGNTSIYGGGVAQTNGSLILIDCTISSNSAAGTGMGIYVQSNATTILRRCTVAGNTATGFSTTGGGISHNSSSLVLDTCTFYGNGYTGGDGGGALSTSGNLLITNCTFFGNHSLIGGGIAAEGGAVTIRNSIIAGNTSTINGAAAAPDCYGTIFSGGFNLVGNRTNSTGWTANDQLGSTASPVNPLLGPLQDNGGLTWTAEPTNGSPAIDKGHSSGATTDQRGWIRTYDKTSVANAVGGDGTDIGALESGLRTTLVTNLNSSGPGSLQYAVILAGAEDLTTINFASNLVGTISVGPGLYLTKNLIINGPGASLVSLSGDELYRVLGVSAGTSVISGLTIRDGSVVGEYGQPERNGEEARAGGILNQANLTMNDCIISNHIARGGAGGETGSGIAGKGGDALGGAIANSGTLTLNRCILAQNSVIGGAGGIATGGGSDAQGGNGRGGSLYNEGTVSLNACTIYNSVATNGSSQVFGASANGGGIYNLGTLELWTSTVASNKAFNGTGGGIYDESPGIYRNSTIVGNQASLGAGIYVSSANIGNTIIAGNSIFGSGDGWGSVVSTDFNLVQDTNGLTINGFTLHSLFGVDPLLGPLQNNGGPTPTMALLPGSPAIDSGSSFGIFTDQRGHRRPFDYFEIPNVDEGDGSDIGAFEVTVPLLKIARVGTNAQLSWFANDLTFKLEFAPNLSPSAVWSNWAGTPTFSSNRYFVLDPMMQSRFYRLRSP